MREIELVVLIIQGITSLYLFSNFLTDRREKHHEDRIFMMLCVYDALWAVGEICLCISQTELQAYLSYIIMQTGFFLWLVAFQFFLFWFIHTKKKLRLYIHTMEIVGGAIVLYGMLPMNAHVVNNVGRLTVQNSSPASIAMLVFLIWLCVNLLYFAVMMYKSSHYRRMKIMGKRAIISGVVLCAGLAGEYLVPISDSVYRTAVIAQFISLIITYFSLNALNSCEINQANMSEFIFFSMASPVLVYNMEGTLQLVNQAARSYLSLQDDEIKNPNKRISSLFEVDEEEVFFYDETTTDIEAMCKRTDSLCGLMINGINDRYGDAIGYVMIVSDLKEKQETMKQLKEAKDAADDANYAKTAFLANMSHEIRTPMNAIVGFSELILSEDIPDKIRDYVTDIRSSSYNLLAIINDILDVSKIESKKMELVEGEYETRTLFEDVYMIIKEQAAKKKLDFSMKMDGDIPCQMYGDMIRIRGILINILNNSVKYTEKGSVSLVASVASREKYIANMQFRISDTGIGITQDDQKVIFESFSQVDKAVNYGKEGTGLGLSIVKGFVDLMGGTIELESVYGEGTTFIVTIPQRVLDETNMKPFLQKKEGRAEGSGLGTLQIKGVRVLVVDDNAINLKMASHSMSHYGLEVDTATSGKQAIEMCREKNYHMVFMDQMMPGMDGIQAMKEIRALAPYYGEQGGVKMVILTANAMSGAKDELLAEGFDEFLGKPINFKELEELLRNHFPEESSD